MATASARKKRRYSLLSGRAPLLSPTSLGVSQAEADEVYRLVLRRSPFAIQEIARQCDRAARSLGFSYSPFDLYTVARQQEEDAERATASYRLVADLAPPPR